MARAKPKATTAGKGSKRKSNKPKSKTSKATAASPEVEQRTADADPVIEQLLRDIEAAEAKHRSLQLSDASDYAHLRQTHLAARLLWSLRADLCFRRSDHDGARKAATTSDEHAKHAARLERDNVVDRIATLERELGISKSLAHELAELE